VIVMKMPYLEDSVFYIQTNENTYEFYAYYGMYDVYIESLEEDEYFVIIDVFERYKKGLDRRTTSYEISDIFMFEPPYGYTEIEVHFTVLKSIIDSYGGFYLNNIEQFLNERVTLYVKYIPGTDSIEYQAGYNDGYNNGFDDGFQVGDQNGFNRGYNVGYDEGYNEGHQDGQSEGYNIGYNFGYNNGYNRGYNDGVRATEPEAYQRGYDDGYEDASSTAINKFTSNLHVWLVPAIIIVVIAGIF